MQLTIEIPEQLAARAAARGVSVEEYVREIFARETVPTLGVAKFRTPEESRAWLDRLAQFSDKIPDLPDEAFKRESFYQDHD